jgi:MraZ protein
MFEGRHVHTIDAKGRLSIPAMYRMALQNEADRPPVLTNLFECLALYPHERWLEIKERISNMSQIRPDVQSLQRFLLSGSTPTPIDRQGRILIPPLLRQHAGLEREVAIAGVGKRIEIWDRERFEVEIQQTCDRSQEIASTVADLGL